MNFDDHDWELGHPPTGEIRDGSTLWKVATGVAVGMLIGGLLVYAVDRQRAPAAGSGTPTTIERLLRNAEPPAAGQPGQRAEPLPAPPTERSPGVPEQAAAPSASAAVGDGAPEVDGVQRAAQRAAERKDRAWARYYQKPAQCDDNPTKAVMVECANHYIRARREFEESYGAGKR